MQYETGTNPGAFRCYEEQLQKHLTHRKVPKATNPRGSNIGKLQQDNDLGSF